MIGVEITEQLHRPKGWIIFATMPLIVLDAMGLFMFPIAVSRFAGEPVAAEASWGSAWIGSLASSG